MARTVIVSLIFVFMLVGWCEALKCQVCNNEECTTQRGYNTENCSQGARFCYKLSSERGVVYRAGCAYTDCSRIQMKPRSTCDVCDRDNCNGLLDLSLDEKDESLRDSAESFEDSHLVRGRNQQHDLNVNSSQQNQIHLFSLFVVFCRFFL